MVYAFPVRSTIAKGVITAIDTGAAQKSDGIITILTHRNAPRLQPAVPEEIMKAGGHLGELIAPLQNNKVEYFGQYIGLVVADTYEQARAAAALVKVSYTKEKAAVDLKAGLTKGTKPTKSQEGPPQINEGAAAAPLAAANRVEATYSTSFENHHPMEPHATIAIWDGADKLTVHHASQSVMTARGTLAYFFNLQPENVRVLSPYLGGAFGCKAGEWMHFSLAAMAAKVVARPVKLVITRQMMFTSTGRRSATVQQVALGADATGKLTALRHRTGNFQNMAEFLELSGNFSKPLYSAPVKEITYTSAKLTLGASTFMRAPGYASGSFPLESGIDEMAYKLKMDPLQFRMLNHTSANLVEKHPYSGEHLMDCYRIGAEAFGWNQRKMQPRHVRRGNYLVGYGMASATYPAHRSNTAVRIRMTADGKVHVMSATHDLGTGTCTIMAQTAADALGIPVENITVEIDDSSLPPAPMSAGSHTTASVTPAVLAAGEQLRKDLIQLAIADSKSSLNGKNPDAIAYGEGKLYLKDDTAKSDSYRSILQRANKETIESCITTLPISDYKLGPKSPPCMPAVQPPADANDDGEKYSFFSFGAQFAEVWVDEDLGTVRVKRFTSVQDAGRIMNEKTARSQVIGGVIYAMGKP